MSPIARKAGAVDLDLDVIAESKAWLVRLPNADALCRRAAEAAYLAGCEQPEAAEACIVLSDDAGLQSLNRQWRGIDAPTDVLSFPCDGDGAGTAPAGAPKLLGDVLVAMETAAEAAADEGRPLGDHLSHLVVHGMLHLLGYDHEADDEAAVMQALEAQILATLGIADPYAVAAAG